MIPKSLPLAYVSLINCKNNLVNSSLDTPNCISHSHIKFIIFKTILFLNLAYILFPKYCLYRGMQPLFMQTHNSETWETSEFCSFPHPTVESHKIRITEFPLCVLCTFSLTCSHSYHLYSGRHYLTLIHPNSSDILASQFPNLFF